MNNKGNVFLDSISMTVSLFVVGILIIIAYAYYSSVNDTYTPVSSTGQGILTNVNSAVLVFNYGFLFVGIGLLLGGVISAFLIDTHPVFFWISFIFLAVSLVVAPQFSNAWYTFITDNEMAVYGNNFPIVVSLLNNLPKFVLAFGILVLIAMYAKTKRGAY